MEERKGFGTNFGFLMASVGSAVGLGNIWGFPNKMGANGGFTFLIIYLILAACCGFIVMMGELALGRKTGRGAIGAYKVLSKRFKWLGWLGVLSAFLILGFYCALGGYCLKYVTLNVGNLFHAGFGTGTLDGAGVFGALMANQGEAVIYGLTTGFGKFSDTFVPEQETAALQRNLIISHACGMGAPLPREVVRGAMLLRCNALARGNSGIRLSTMETLLQMLNRGVHPIIPEKGSLGASGDLAPLSHMVLVMLGEGEAEYQGRVMPGREAMAAAGIETIQLAAKEGLALINGTQIMTAIAFLYFVQEQCDIVSLEVGLGGRMDSTNVIPAPEVCVVANIGLEHTAILGDTVEKIAAEKCGIIKHGSHAVLFGQSEGVENVAREKCAQEDVALTITAQEKLERISSSLDGQEFKYRGRGPYHLRLLGEYQLLNALTVIDVCNALRSRGWDKLTDEAIDEGLSHAQWPGRLELLRRGPDFIVDGAHNPQCVDALMDSLAALYGDKKLIFLTGVLRDKDWQQMLRRALPLAKAFVVITPPSARALDENELAAWLNAQGVQAVPAKDTDDGVRRALALAGEDDAICSWGSLYFTGEVRRVLTEQ